MKYEVIMGVPKVSRLYNYLRLKVDSEEATSEETDFYDKISDAIDYLEQGYGIDKDKQVPARFLSKKREHLDKLSRKLTNLLDSDKFVKVHHWHLEREGKYKELFWARIPDTNLILITHIAEEHPRDYNNLNLSVLPSGNNSNGSSDKEIVSEPKSDYNDYPKNLQFDCLGKLIRVSINEYRLGAVYVDNKSQFYFFLKLKRQMYIYFKLTNSGLKKLFKYKFDSKTYDENPLKLTLIKDILKSYSKQLCLVDFKDSNEIINSIDYDEVIFILRQQGNEEVRFKSVNESIELVMELEDIYLAELMTLLKNSKCYEEL